MCSCSELLTGACAVAQLTQVVEIRDLVYFYPTLAYQDVQQLFPSLPAALKQPTHIEAEKGLLTDMEGCMKAGPPHNDGCQLFAHCTLCSRVPVLAGAEASCT